MRKRLALSLVAARSCNKITKQVVSFQPRIIARSFLNSPSYRRNCDWGRPCDCSECMEILESPTCQICEVRPTVTQSSARSYDRKGIAGYSSTSFCEQCWEKYKERKRSEEQKKEQMLALRVDRMEKMLEGVRGLHSTKQVPIKYAVERLRSDVRFVRNSFNSQQWFQQDLIERLSQSLQILKVRNRYICNKWRVDAMDFKCGTYMTGWTIKFETFDRLYAQASRRLKNVRVCAMKSHCWLMWCAQDCTLHRETGSSYQFRDLK